MDSVIDRVRNGWAADFYYLPDANHPKVGQCISALANGTGGSLILGVKENGKINGILPESEIGELREIFSNNLTPEIELVTETLIVGHHQVLEIYVNAAEEKVKFKGQDGAICFVYGGAGPVAANKIILGCWKLQKTNPDVSIDHNDEEIEKLIRVKGPLTLSQVYKLSQSKMSAVDESIIKLLFKGKLELIWKDGIASYRAD